jgi:imidazolonepropionase-like amidohydrolase
MQPEPISQTLVTVIHCGTLFDGVSIAKNVYIHVVNNFITEVSAQGRASYSGCDKYLVVEMDLSTHFVMPGLIDCHAHPCILDVKCVEGLE